jgi:hypothetical protein
VRGAHKGLGALVCTELPEDGLQMGPHGVRRDAECPAELVVRQATAEPGEDLLFPGREAHLPSGGMAVRGFVVAGGARRQHAVVLSDPEEHLDGQKLCLGRLQQVGGDVVKLWLLSCRHSFAPVVNCGVPWARTGTNTHPTDNYTERTEDCGRQAILCHLSDVGTAKSAYAFVPMVRLRGGWSPGNQESDDL